jgi:rare lipoprotein A (peptidoglycan hydrolase)
MFLRFFRIGPPRAALSLLLTGSLALIGAQQVLGGVPAGQSTAATVGAHDLQPLTESDAAPGPDTVAAAVTTGHYEEVFKPTPVPTLAPSPAPILAPAPAPSEAADVTLYESGIASTYGEGDGFEGNRTACGQIFHTNIVQIAHKSLPCGTHVRVEDVSTGNTVDAQVTDRGPYIAGRVVDLSWGAFRRLEPNGPGLLHVNVYVVQQ